MHHAQRPAMSRDNLGNLLVRRSILSAEQVGDAIAAARIRGGTWLEHLLEAGVLDEHRLVDWVSYESKVPRCDPSILAAVPPDVIARIPPEVAYEHRLVPVSLESDGYLQVAMVDPTDNAAIEEAEFFAGVTLIRQVAAATAIAWALHRYYGAPSRLWPHPSPVAGVAVG
jgi:hypothetical protein